MGNLLLLSAGTNACYHIAKTLKEKFSSEFYIVGADINEQYLTPTCNYLDAFYKVPYSSSPDYYKTILDICQKENIDFLLPSFDADQKLFYPENPDLINIGVTSLSTSIDTLPIYDNKAKINNFLQNEGLPIPKQYSFEECTENELYMVKPINGVGSVGAALRTIDDMKLLNMSNFIIQERCSEPEITMECFWFEGNISTICRERIAAKAGVCTKTRIFKDKNLEDIGIKFAQKIKTPHIFNLQFMKNQQDEYVITDVNLRTAGGMSLSYAAGWDEVSALAKIMIGKNDISEIFATLPQQIHPRYIVRAYTDIVTKIEKPVIAFDFDGTLLDSRERHKIVLDDVLVSKNINIDTSDLVEFKRNGKNNIDFLISKGVEQSIAQEVQSEWIRLIENEKYLEQDILYPNTIEILERHSKENNLILVTARNNKTGLRNQIDKFDLRKYFKEIYVVNSDQNTSAKKADILIKENVVEFIGDTLSDKKAADIAKIVFTHVNDGFHKKEIIKE
ncbi:MAG: ATP-grasp domain-containing protein [Alphaproteobacteria bacterium]|nr:ATP-grasp domain-containing protein [Alphaproteobacteria bacterium]